MSIPRFQDLRLNHEISWLEKGSEEVSGLNLPRGPRRIVRTTTERQAQASLAALGLRFVLQLEKFRGRAPGKARRCRGIFLNLSHVKSPPRFSDNPRDSALVASGNFARESPLRRFTLQMLATGSGSLQHLLCESRLSCLPLWRDWRRVAKGVGGCQPQR